MAGRMWPLNSPNLSSYKSHCFRFYYPFVLSIQIRDIVRLLVYNINVNIETISYTIILSQMKYHRICVAITRQPITYLKSTSKSTYLFFCNNEHHDRLLMIVVIFYYVDSWLKSSRCYKNCEHKNKQGLSAYS